MARRQLLKLGFTRKLACAMAILRKRLLGFAEGIAMMAYVTIEYLVTSFPRIKSAVIRYTIQIFPLVFGLIMKMTFYWMGGMLIAYLLGASHPEIAGLFPALFALWRKLEKYFTEP